MSAKPWHRIRGKGKETNAAWRAFRIYRDMGYVRTAAKAWIEYREGTGKKPIPLPRWFNEWQSYNKWTARCQAFDEAEYERVRLANERKRDAARQVLVDGAKAAAQSMLVMARGKRLPEQTVESSVARAAQRDVLKIAGVEPPERIEITGADGGPVEFALDISKLDDEDLRALARIQDKMASGDDDGGS